MLGKKVQLQSVGENIRMLFLCLNGQDAGLPSPYRVDDNVMFDVDMPRPAPRVLVGGQFDGFFVVFSDRDGVALQPWQHEALHLA